jgi:hypothetical protein
VVESELYVSSNFIIQQNEAFFNQYIASGRNLNNVISVSYLMSESRGDLIQKYDVVNKHSCHHCGLFRSCCHDNKENVPRGLHPDEVMLV